MSTIERPTKSYGTRKYVSEVAAAPGNYAPILSSEVDGDIDGIYNAWNLGADSVNIKDLAVTTAKLQDLGVTAAKIAAGAITDTKLGNNSITTAKIVDGQVTAAKMAVGGSVRQFHALDVPAGKFINSPGSPIPFATFPSTAFQGGLVLVFGTVGWRLNMGPGNWNVQLMWLRDGSAIPGFTQFNLGCNSSCQVPLPTPYVMDWQANVGAHVYSLCAGVAGVAGSQVITDGSWPGQLYLVELA